MSERLLRTFISITLPKKVVVVQEMLKTTIVGKNENLKWVNPGGIHLTLKFLGATPPEAIDDINKVLEKVVEKHNGMEFTLTGTGCFPAPDRPRVLWLGVDGDVPQLQDFVNDIDKKLESLGFPIEEKEFKPHITIARVSYPPKLTPDIGQYLNVAYEPISFNINRIRLMRSELLPDGAVHSILGTYFLKAEAE